MLHFLAEMALVTTAALVIGVTWFYVHIRRADRADRYQKIMRQRRVNADYWRDFTQYYEGDQ